MINQTFTVPRKESLEALFDSISFAASQYRENFNWRSYQVRAVCESARRSLMGAQLESNDVRALLDRFQKELFDAAVIDFGGNSGINPATAFDQLCFTASIHFQAYLLTRVARLQAYGPAFGADVIRILSHELIATWRHAPWFVHSINCAQPEINL